ncbi:MAG: hypothetical protein HQL11_05190 [Candidatus Omnitrophica bacterium]|nr:hypothetical protein [Candidatus Omnitrophota bacterium]
MSKYRRAVLAGVLLAIWVFAAPGIAQAAKEAFFEVSFGADKNVMTLGDELEVRVDILHGEGYVLKDLKPPKDLTPFQIKSRKRLDPQTAGGATSEGFRVILTVFELGEFEVPAFEILFKTPDGKEGVVTTDVWPLRVVSVGRRRSDTEDVRGIKGQKSLWPASEIWRRLAVWAAGLLGSLALAGILWGFIRWFLAWREARRPPHERALRALARLESQKLYESGRHKEFYTQLAVIVKTYLMRQLSLGSPDLTTAQTVALLQADARFVSLREPVAGLLARADMVKFAKASPGSEESRRCLAEARSLVQEGLKVPDPAAAVAAAGGAKRGKTGKRGKHGRLGTQ